MGQLEVTVEQVGPATSKATARTHSAMVDRPAAKGGSDQGPLGGEYLLIALGGCFMSNLLAAIRARDAEVRDVRVRLTGTIDGSPERFTAFTVRIAATHRDADGLRKLVTIAERACSVTNTLRQAAPISFEIES